MFYSAGSGENSVQGVMVKHHVYICCRHSYMYALAAFLLAYIDVMVMPSGYDFSCSSAGGCGMSDVYMFTGVIGKVTPLRDACLYWHWVDVCSLNVEYMMCIL